MGKVSPFSPFRLEDFASQRDWIDTLFFPLNNVLSQVTQALNGQINSDNIPTFTKVLSGQNLSVPFSFQISAGLTPTQMIVAQAFKTGVPICMVGSWALNGDTLTVNQLFELSETGNLPIAPGTKYQIVLKFT